MGRHPGDRGRLIHRLPCGPSAASRAPENVREGRSVCTRSDRMNCDSGGTTMDTTGDGVTALGRDILGDVEKLIGQHFDLLRQEVKDELAKAAGAGLAVTTGAGATAVGGLLGVLAAVHLLQKA